jgi:hypothetical protein
MKTRAPIASVGRIIAEGGRRTTAHRSCLRSACEASAHCQLELVLTGVYTAFGTPADRGLHYPHTLRPPATGSNSTDVLGVRPNSRFRVATDLGKARA